MRAPCVVAYFGSVVLCQRAIICAVQYGSLRVGTFMVPDGFVFQDIRVLQFYRGQRSSSAAMMLRDPKTATASASWCPSISFGNN